MPCSSPRRHCRRNWQGNSERSCAAACLGRSRVPSPYRSAERALLEKAGFADVPHIVVVQTEDLHRFQPFATGGVQLQSTADVLPQCVESERVRALNKMRRYGRRLTRFCTSLNKRFGWCDWVRYSGWQIQQITKLKVSAETTHDVTVVLDSDLVITRPFNLQVFVPGGATAVFEDLSVTPHSPGLPWKWHCNARALLKRGPADRTIANGYFATPFVFDRRTLTSLFSWLEAEYLGPWYQVLLSQPVASWSEFCIYTQFARECAQTSRLAFIQNPCQRSLVNPDQRSNHERFIQESFSNPEIYFMNIPSDRRGKQRWAVKHYDAVLSQYLGPLHSTD